MAAGNERIAPVFATLTRNTGTLLASNVGSAILSFALTVLIGRVLGEQGLGVYAAALAWIFPLSLLADAGLGTLMTRDLVLRPEAEADYLGASALARLYLGGCLMLAVIALAPLLSAEPAVSKGIILSAPLIVVNPFYGVFTAIFRARRIMWPVACLNLGMLAAQVILTIFVFSYGGNVIDALAVNVLTSAGQLAAAWALYRRRFAPAINPQAPALSQARTLLRRAWPFALAAALAALNLRISLILLERLADVAQTGYYAAAYRFAEAARMLPNALFGALFPALASLAGDAVALPAFFKRMNFMLFGLGALAGLLGAFAGEWFITLVFGRGFAPAAQTLQVIAWSLLPGLLRSGWTLYWYALQREHLVNATTAAAIGLQIILSLWLIPLHGAAGAALAVLITEIAALILLWLPLLTRARIKYGFVSP